MKIVLVNCPPQSVRAPPLGLCYLAAYLRKYKHKIFLFDFNIDCYSKAKSYKEKYLWNRDINTDWIQAKSFSIKKEIDQWVDKIMKTKSKIIGLSVIDDSKDISLELAKSIKKKDPSKIIIFGGPFCNRTYLKKNEYLNDKDYIDIVVIDEGEETLREVIERIETGKKLDNCKGILLRKNGKMIDFGDRQSIHNLDELPFPDYSDLELSKYAIPEETSILGSRGCISKCVFCQDTIFMGKFRSRTAGNIFREMNVRFNQGYREFFFNDLMMNSNPKELEKLCTLILKSRLKGKIRMSGQLRCRKMKSQLFKKLKHAGCHSLLFGVESGSQRILDYMNKGYTVKTAEKNIRDTHEAGIETGICILVGFPGETDKTISDTIKFIKRNHKFIDRLAAIYQLELRPGCYIDTHYKSFKIIKNRDNYWETKDGKNNFPWRLEQIHKIINTALSLNIKLEFDEVHFYYYHLLKYYHKYMKDYDKSFDIMKKSLEEFSIRIKSLKEQVRAKDYKLKELMNLKDYQKKV